ncbi:NUDIX domain-containing protein [Candidatus Kaistella beijingensis]|uniref:NUDIX domain-containing protein n=1 Tax=Candidatus Kaistella beijingensis TaxID=2820270 RepID=UPI001CC8108C|nr:NUDIX domain-containing protein [Candidatus Kaistella beijingensis]UBB90026.1 NUDIX domain-containing protein [Candidatus Kaistella beijingensis]
MDKYLMFASTMKEKVLESAKKRLQLEMGIDCNLKCVYSFIYKEKVENNLIEHGFDHIFKGYSDEKPKPNLHEIKDYKWMSIADIFSDIPNNRLNKTTFKKIHV